MPAGVSPIRGVRATREAKRELFLLLAVELYEARQACPTEAHGDLFRQVMQALDEYGAAYVAAGGKAL